VEAPTLKIKKSLYTPVKITIPIPKILFLHALRDGVGVGWFKREYGGVIFKQLHG